MNKNKFYEFKNIAENEFSLYVYGEIVSEKTVNWWTGEKNENEVDITDFKQALADIPNGASLKMYVNSVGGSVFATSAIVSMLQRAKARGVQIDAYVDGIACSCASWLIMVADNINIYKNSVMMIHKPMLMSYGNANDLQKDIEVLNKIEDGVIIPFYEAKAKSKTEVIKQMMSDETWLTAAEIQEHFNVNLIDEEKTVENVKSDLFNTYRNTPREFKQEEKPVENIVEKPTEQVDYSAFEQTINELKGGKK
jgi:ATP-dependent protease ClpP protease subunit